MWRLALSWVKFTDRKSKTQGQLHTRNPVAGKRLSLFGQLSVMPLCVWIACSTNSKERLPNNHIVKNLISHIQPAIYCIVCHSNDFPTKGFLAHYSSFYSLTYDFMLATSNMWIKPSLKAVLLGWVVQSQIKVTQNKPMIQSKTSIWPAVNLKKHATLMSSKLDITRYNCNITLNTGHWIFDRCQLIIT